MCCPTSKKPGRKVNDVNYGMDHQEDASDDSYVHQIHEVHHNSSTIYAEMLVAGKATKFELDTGAAVNVLPYHTLTPDTKLEASKN